MGTCSLLKETLPLLGKVFGRAMVNRLKQKNILHGLVINENAVHRLSFKVNQLIYCEGSTPLGFYLVEEGMVKVLKSASYNKQQILRLASPGEALNSDALLLNTKYNTSAEAMKDCELLFIPKDEFWTLIKNNKIFTSRFLHLVSEEILLMEVNVTDLAYKPVRGRLLDAIVLLSEKFKEEKGGDRPITISRSDLASFVGTARETVNRLLSEFREKKLVKTNGLQIEVINLSDLYTLSRYYH